MRNRRRPLRVDREVVHVDDDLLDELDQGGDIGGKVKINLADKTFDRVVDFAGGDVDVATGTGTSRTMSIDGADHQMLSVTASFTIAISDYVYLDGSAGFEKRTDKQCCNPR